MNVSNQEIQGSWTKGGFPAEEVKGEVPPYFTCPICTDVIRDCADLECPQGHCFCWTCARDLLGSNFRQTCPVCRSKISSRPRQCVLVDRQIDQTLKWKCPHPNCNWTGERSAREKAHIPTCALRPRPCLNVLWGCEMIMTENEIEEHLKNCPFQIIECPIGGDQCNTFQRRELVDHEMRCRNKSCKYSKHDGCPFKGDSMSLVLHEEYCKKLHEKLHEISASYDDLAKWSQERKKENEVYGDEIDSMNAEMKILRKEIWERTETIRELVQIGEDKKGIIEEKDGKIRDLTSEIVKHKYEQRLFVRVSYWFIDYWYT